MAKQVILWQKVFENRDKEGNKVPSFAVLVPCKATVVGESTPICGTCREPELGHSRRNRRHTFSNPIGGLALDVTYVRGQKARLENVQQGKEANCWTEGK
jgi:hypothetical protein